MAFNVARGILTITSQYFVHVSDSNEYTTQLTGKVITLIAYAESGRVAVLQVVKEGQGVAAWIQQLVTCLVYMLSNYLCWSSSASKHRISTNPMMPVCWLLISITTFGDSMAHLLYTRVGQLPFPLLYRNRGAWLLACFWLFFGHDELIVLLTVVSMLSSLQYVTSMGRCTAEALKIKVFSIPYNK